MEIRKDTVPDKCNNCSGRMKIYDFDNLENDNEKIEYYICKKCGKKDGIKVINRE